MSGDAVDLKIVIDTSCHLVLLTQGNTKVFRDRPGSSYLSPPDLTDTSRRLSTSQRITATISPNSSLFLLPSPVVCFERSSYSQGQVFYLEDPQTSSLLLLDWFTSGRLSRGESWAFDKYRSANEVYIQGKRLFNDVLLLKGANDIRRRMGPYVCYCTVIIYGTTLSELLDHFSQLARDFRQYKRNKPDDILWSYNELEAGLSGIVRCAGAETETVKMWLETQLEPLREVVGRDIYKAAFV